MKQPNATNLFDDLWFYSRKVLPCTRFEDLREMLRIRHSDCLTLKMETLFTSKTSVSIYQSRRRNVLDDLNFPAVFCFSSWHLYVYLQLHRNLSTIWRTVYGLLMCPAIPQLREGIDLPAECTSFDRHVIKQVCMSSVRCPVMKNEYRSTPTRRI